MPAIFGSSSFIIIVSVFKKERTGHVSRDYYEEKVGYMLKCEYKELLPREYYRWMFPTNSFQKNGEARGDYKPNALLQYHCKSFKTTAMSTCVVFDEHEIITECIRKEGRFSDVDFSLISGCSYIGKSKSNKNARHCHALIFDLDEVDKRCLENFIGMTGAKLIPMPSAISISGNGVHIVYILDTPVRLTVKNLEMMTDLKALLTRKLWNSRTSLDPHVQYQGIVQGYRTVGSQTKRGHIVRAFRIGNKISVEELISYAEELDIVPFRHRAGEPVYTERLQRLKKDKHTIEKMKNTLCSDSYSIQELRADNPDWFEDWYQRRIIEKQKPGHLHIGRKPYDKWLALIKEQAREGNRRRCIYCLGAWAQKCDVSEAEFTNNAYSLIPLFDSLTGSENNHFTRENVDSVIAQYKTRDLTRMSIRAMERMTGLVYPKEEKRKQERKGRPDKEQVVREYLSAHPTEQNISKIAADCGVSRPTVYKYLAS